jgi:hypothetical protein
LPQLPTFTLLVGSRNQVKGPRRFGRVAFWRLRARRWQPHATRGDERAA